MLSISCKKLNKQLTQTSDRVHFLYEILEIFENVRKKLLT